MSKRPTDRARRTLSLRRETLRKLSSQDLVRIAGGTDSGTWGCVPETDGCDTTQCWLSTVSRYC
jgi:hypothetical protein